MISTSSFKNKRSQAFDLLKLFAIFLVVYGHCVQHFLSTQPTDEPVYQYIYSFHMPLFMMISGYFSISSMQLTPFTLFIKKKFTQLLLPCISWGLLWWIKDPLISILNQDLQLHLNKLIRILIDNFWFLKSLFFCYLLYYICNRFSGLKHEIILVITCFISFFITKYNINLMYPCFIAGVILKKKFNNGQTMTFTVKNFIVLAIFIFLIYSWDYYFLQYNPHDLYQCLSDSDYLSVVSEYFYILFYRILTGITGGISFILIFNTVFHHTKENKLYRYCSEWGTYTLGIYILQYFILERFLIKFIRLDNYSSFLSNFIIFPILSIIIIGICIFIIKIIKRNSILNLILLGVKNK